MALGHGKPLAPFAFFNDQKFEVADQAENQLFFNLLPFDYDGLGEENFEFVWEPLQDAVADPGIAPQYFQDDVSDFNDTETEVYDFYANAPLSDPNEVAVSRVEYPDWVDDELINDEALYPDYWAIPPPIDPNEVPFPYHDASSEPDELDTSNDDLGFALSPLADDNDVAVSRVTDATEQPSDPEDEPFEFTQDAVPLDAAVTPDQIYPECSDNQLEADEELPDFTQDAVADPQVVQSNQVFVEDGSTNWDVEPEEPTQDFFDAPLSDDAVAPAPVALPDQATPGRILRIPGLFKVEPDEEKLARRIREGTIVLEPVAEIPRLLDEHFKRAGEVRRGIAVAKAEAAALRDRIAEIIAEEGIKRTLAERTRIEKELLLAEQQLLLLLTQEAVLMEEQEVIDVAFITLVAYSTLQ